MLTNVTAFILGLLFAVVAVLLGDWLMFYLLKYIYPAYPLTYWQTVAASVLLAYAGGMWNGSNGYRATKQ